MSQLLESLLSPQRRAQCQAGDMLASLHPVMRQAFVPLLARTPAEVAGEACPSDLDVAGRADYFAGWADFDRRPNVRVPHPSTARGRGYFDHQRQYMADLAARNERTRRGEA